MYRLSVITLSVVVIVSHIGCNATDRCDTHDHTVCVQGVVHWVDACGTLEEEIESCDCGCNQDYSDCQEPCECEPQCDGKECGSNMCGGTCPPGCGEDQQCNPITGQCETVCQPDCVGKCCGDDGCGGECPDSCDATGQACNLETCLCEGTCEPDCTGRECGPDGCGAACAPGCDSGELCNQETGLCEVHCVPDCVGRVCGLDGCGGTCEPGCPEGQICSDEGLCLQYECGSLPPTVTGALDTSVAAVAYDEAQISLVHKRDIDEYEDGCIVSIDMDLWHGTGCQLKLSAGGRYSQQGGLLIHTVEFSADSFCRNFPDHTEGTYVANGNMVVAEVEPAVMDVPGYNVEDACFPSDFVIRLDGILHRITDGEELTVGPAEILVTGDSYSTGHTEYSCPCVPDCTGKECGDDGCGTPCGTCADQPVYCSDNGLCIDDCDGLECGTSPVHGYYCGTCQSLESCIEGECLCDYAPCGQLCCAAGEICYDNECCLPNCEGRECGSDGCGGSCGSCSGSTEYCDSSGQCIDDCSGRVCGDSPVEGYNCGSCSGATVYCNSAGQCIDDCAGRVCGESPVEGYDCGSCSGATVYCSSGGQCLDDCAGRECGTSPNAGFNCGSCQGDYVYCSSSGQCTCQHDTCGAICCPPGQTCYLGSCCTPQCGGAVCGDDGCGGSCGTCPSSAPVCDAGGCVECLSSADCPDPDVFTCENKVCVLHCDEDMYEPNSTSSDAVDIQEPFEAALTMCGKQDDDWFQVYLSGGVTYYFDILFSDFDGDIDLYLKNSGLSTIADALSTSDNEHIEYTVPSGAGGSYYIRVYLYSGYTQTYTLQVSD